MLSIAARFHCSLDVRNAMLESMAGRSSVRIVGIS